MLLKAKQQQMMVGLLLIELDYFRHINDTLGHIAGDHLLHVLGKRFQTCFGTNTIIARLGGDEFVVIVNSLDVDKKGAYDKAYIVAEKIRLVLAEPYLLLCKKADEQESVVEHYSPASIGVALFINYNASKEEIIKFADTAMYDAKAGGGNQVSFFQTDK